MMEWTHDLIFEFLTLYKNEPAIWNTSSPQHKSRSDAHEAWLRIKTGLKGGTIPITELKKKKENLMSTYRKLKGKIKDSVKTGADDIYKPEWPFYDIMAIFLDKVYKPRKTKTSITVESNEDTPASCLLDEPDTPVSPKREIPSPDITDDPLSTPERAESPQCHVPPSRKRPKKTSPLHHHTAQSSELHSIKDQVINNKIEEDEFDHFGKNVASQLRQLPILDALDVQSDILNLIKTSRQAVLRRTKQEYSLKAGSDGSFE